MSTPADQLPQWQNYRGISNRWESAAPASIPDTDEVEWADYAKSIMGGGASIAQATGWLAGQLGAEDVGASIEDLGRDAVDYWHDSLSDPAKAEISKQIVRKSEDGSGLGGYEWGDASFSTVALMGAESLMGTGLGMGIGASLTKVLQMFANPFGRTVLANAAKAPLEIPGVVGAGISAGGRSQAIKKLALVDAVIGGVGFGVGEGAVGGVSTGASVYDNIMGLDPEKLLENDRYKQIFESTDESMSELERHQYAAETVAGEASTAAGWQSGLTTALLGAPMGAYFGRILGGARLSSTLPRAVATGAAGEATQEFFQSGAEQLISNMNRQPFEPDLDLFEGVVEAAVAGAAAGGLLGGVVGPASVKGARQEQAQDQQIESLDRRAELEKIGGPVGQAVMQAANQGVSRKALGNIIHDWSTSVLAEDAALENIEALVNEQLTGEEARNTGPDPGPALGTDEQIEAEKNKPPPSEEEVGEKLERDAEKPVQIETVDASSLHIDAPTYQFKSATGAKGVSKALKGVKKFQSYKAGLAIVHERDVTEDGARYAVDGHQRASLARQALEAGQPRSELSMAAVIYKESDGHTAESVTRLAALKNIGEQTGSPVDAAKVIREMGPAGAEEIANLPPNHALVKQGNAIAKLSDEAFNLAVNEIIPQAQAAVVGEMVQDEALQTAAFEVLRQTEPENINQARAIVAQVMTAGTTSETTEDLFGEQTVTESLYLERAKVLDSAQRLARRDKATFKTLTDKESSITGTGENKLDRAANEAKISEANRALTTLSTVANTKGPVSDALTEAARRVKAGEKPGTVAKDFLSTALPAIEGRSVDGKKAGKDKRTSTKKSAAKDVDIGDAVPVYSKRSDDVERREKNLSRRIDAIIDGRSFEQLSDEDRTKIHELQQSLPSAGEQQQAAKDRLTEKVATKRKAALDKEIERRDRLRNTGQQDLFSRVKLSRELEVEETGERVTVEENSDDLLRRLTKRMGVVEQLRVCVGG